jgi:hypothetical protein
MKERVFAGALLHRTGKTQPLSTRTDAGMMPATTACVGLLPVLTAHSSLVAFARPLQASAKEVQDSEGAAALRDQLKNLAEGLNGAASGMSTVIDGIVKGFPGPLLNSTLAVIERQVRAATVCISAGRKSV